MKTKLAVDLKVGETLTIGSTTIRLEKKSGQTARLVVCAEKQTARAAGVTRYEEIKAKHPWPNNEELDDEAITRNQE